MMISDGTPLLSMRGLSVTFDSQSGPVSALYNIDLDIWENDRLAIMGESGCGKSVLGHAAMRLLDDIATVKGCISYRGKDLSKMDNASVLKLRGKAISLVPQNPSTSFDPVIKIGAQMQELIEKTGIARGKKARGRALEYLSRANFPDPASIFNTYPHRLSGGMCERVLIAMAASTEPDLLIADEPTKGLDPTSMDAVLGLLHKLSRGSSLMMITHDFRAASTCKRAVIMYSGEIVEEGPAATVLERPSHYYTRGLVDAQPSRGMKPIRGKRMARTDDGCRFMERCEAATDLCKNHPGLRPLGDGRMVRCHYA